MNILLEKRIEKIQLKKRKGVTLAITIMIFLVVSILLFSISIVFSTNLKQATHQEKKMKAHYLALSGIEITKSTLLKPLSIQNGKEINMIEYIKLNPDIYPKLEDSVQVDGTEVNITVEYDKDDYILNITSIAEYDDGIEAKLKLKMDVETTKYTEFWE